ncbi:MULTISPECIES: ArpU family phage packaging/lysis transcriptional regulator [Aerococcus]|uniref:Transcriptional regulator n=1 Tax=Aerococcus tenax TaxID=3078812 RepID=A0A329NBF7_9LACT|nr:MULTISPECIES: ArpU family phage packaging/lysis transcriptional regulator [Aerococcus]MDL5184758.1 ArpU family phage packaging/lysis transcriptional regulator [Aerococcus mictus]KAA9238586.1 hypothetical protein F6I34_08055 [Aerococcus urinae]MDK6371983.1 ArpU family phage packaging/lysis transcriptional regulator [Aerococcus urinae]MDK7302423.1 ArpU family phage packaging/lysis transcriptional regulator [Aerococcus urinae]MDK7802282.1 ArpU family phage packaging/lysis transcriptional regul
MWRLPKRDEIDKYATINKVESLLEEYPRLCRVAGVKVQQSLTANYNSVAVSHSTTNTNEESIINAIGARKEIQDIDYALSLLNDTNRKILEYKYKYGYGDRFAYSRLAISESTYYRYLIKAKIEFAEAYCNGVLLVKDGARGIGGI